MTISSLIFMVVAAPLGHASQLPPNQSDLKFDDLFPRRPFFGKSAREVKWSPDDRYLAYLWNPYDDPGFDIWLFDTAEQKATRLTSIEFMAKYDRDAPRALVRHRQEQLEEEKVEKMSDEERRQWELDQRKKNEERREPLPTYSGIGELEWAHRSNELVFTYNGDIFRWKVGDKEPRRLTRTRDREQRVEYTADDNGLYFQRGEGVYRIRFDSPEIVQLNPTLPAGLTMSGYSISPDGSTLMLTAAKSSPERQVDYITYRERFAQARKASRSVADDPFRTELYLYLYDLNDDPAVNPKHDGKPWEVWSWKGGEEYQELSIHNEPWSADSKRLTFASWKRNARELSFHVATVADRKLETVYQTTHDGEHRSPSMADPCFTLDDQRIVAMIETDYRHTWLIDPATKSAIALTQGPYEVYPLELTKDRRAVLARSSKEDPARANLYRVDISTGEMTRLTHRVGMYGQPEFNHAQTRAAVSFASWTEPRELCLVDFEGKQQDRVLTQSHRKEFAKVNRLTPTLFRYPNRRGQTIHGFMFLPPGWKKSDRRPLMIYVYGGPLGSGKSVEDGSFNTTAYWFNMYLSYALGYVTVTIDPRGQSGYGAEFGKANWEAPGVAQVEDLADGVRYLVDHYGVDPAKVGVNGWSFGGFQTQMCLYTAPDVFTLGIAGAGPTEWQNYNTWYSGGVIGKSKVGDPKALDRFSLTHLAKNLKSPLLLLHGIEDTNVLFQDTIAVYRKLLQFGKGPLVELAVDPTGGHGMGGDMSSRDRHAIYLAFIWKHWGAPKPGSAGGAPAKTQSPP